MTTCTDLPTLLQCHLHAFAALGGMPVLYDKQKQVVLSRTADGPRLHPEFLSFCGQFGFRPRLCRPYRAKTKGKEDAGSGRRLLGRHAGSTVDRAQKSVRSATASLLLSAAGSGSLVCRRLHSLVSSRFRSRAIEEAVPAQQDHLGAGAPANSHT